jgi:hypothetical protein
VAIMKAKAMDVSDLVMDAERKLGELQTKLSATRARREALGKEREGLAYSAHIGDRAAAASLQKDAHAMQRVVRKVRLGQQDTQQIGIDMAARACQEFCVRAC